MKHIHDVLGIPEDGVVVEGGAGVEPESELLLPAPRPLRPHVRVQLVLLVCVIPQELHIYLVLLRTVRRWLHVMHPPS